MAKQVPPGPFAIANGFVSAEHLIWMRVADNLCELIFSKVTTTFPITAHHMCAAYHIMNHERLGTGVWHFGTCHGIQHSWIKLLSRDNIILDIYPLGQVRPLIVAPVFTVTEDWAEIYVGEPAKFTFAKDGDHSKDVLGPVFRREVEEINRIIIDLMQGGPRVILPGTPQAKGNGKPKKRQPKRRKGGRPGWGN